MGIFDRLRSRFASTGDIAPLAAIYRLSTRLVIHAHHCATHGVYVAAEPVIELPADASSEQVGTAVMSALAGFRSGLVIDTRALPQPSKVLTALGVKSWRAVPRDVLLCHVSQERDVYKVTALHHLGSGRFTPLPGDHDHHVPLSEGATTLGKAVSIGHSRSEGLPSP